MNLHKCFANWWNIGGVNLDFLTQAISDNWDEYDQEEQPHITYWDEQNLGKTTHLNRM